MLLLSSSLLLLASSAHAYLSQGFFPLDSPSRSQPWVIGETNTLSWEVGLSSGDIKLPPSFDVILQDPFHAGDSMRVATQVPLSAGSIAIYLGEEVPTGSTWYVSLGNTWQGEIFAISEPFIIYPAGTSNVTVPTPPTFKPTVTLDHAGSIGRDFAVTMTGSPLPTLDTTNSAFASLAPRLGWVVATGAMVVASGWWTLL
ncbi:hypothetical protein BDY24DRAFT_400101 [Mrakia frigida]|uniref:uncharacterized protein n=1 Tax=Mrakia frigida TaxID=29902 RepID=UPI003FCBF39C